MRPICGFSWESPSSVLGSHHTCGLPRGHENEGRPHECAACGSRKELSDDEQQTEPFHVLVMVSL